MKINLICALVLTAAALPTLQTVNAQTAPDNTKANQTDPSNRQMTADSQKENETDRGLAQRIRKSIVADKGLSTYAHNVKIVAINGQVTLNGVVRSDEERAKVASLAVEVAGKQNVVNDLKVAPPKS